MAFNQSLTFELREPRTALVGLGPPHVPYGFVAGLPEAGDEPGMVFEMTIEDAPLSSRGPFHGVDSSLGEAPLAHLVPNRHDPLLSLIVVFGQFTAVRAHYRSFVPGMRESAGERLDRSVRSSV